MLIAAVVNCIVAVGGVADGEVSGQEHGGRDILVKETAAHCFYVFGACDSSQDWICSNRLIVGVVVLSFRCAYYWLAHTNAFETILAAWDEVKIVHQVLVPQRASNTPPLLPGRLRRDVACWPTSCRRAHDVHRVRWHDIVYVYVYGALTKWS